MRATTLLNKVLRFKSTRVVGVSFTQDGLVCDVVPTTSIAQTGKIRLRKLDGYEKIARVMRDALDPAA